MKKIIILLNLILLSSAFAMTIYCPGSNGVPAAEVNPAVQGPFSPAGCTEAEVGEWLKAQCGQCPAPGVVKYANGAKFKITANWIIHVKGAIPGYPNGIQVVTNTGTVTCEQKGNKSYCPMGSVDGNITGTINWQAKTTGSWRAHVNGQEVTAVIDPAVPTAANAKIALANYVQQNGAGTFNFAPTTQPSPFTLKGGCTGAPVQNTQNLCQPYVQAPPTFTKTIKVLNAGPGTPQQ